MNFILSQLIAAAIFLLIWKLNELVNNQNVYVKLLREESLSNSKFK